jgi:chemotaxis methyl-accepting protein methylase
VTAPDDRAFHALTRQISRRAGLTLAAYKDKCIRRRIAVRMRACGVHTYSDYQSLLERSPMECERLRDALTINVTRFYRNADTWNLLRRDVIPALVPEPDGALYVWSAGCSSGEESYTLAVLFADHLELAGLSPRLDRVTIDATDIDRVSLDRARAARYPMEALTEMPADLVRGYFEGVGREREVSARVRSRVMVRAHDLNADAPPRHGYGLILCRNVVIYFDRPTQERLFDAFAGALRPGGFLVLGKVETIFGPVRLPRQRVRCRGCGRHHQPDDAALAPVLGRGRCTPALRELAAALVQAADLADAAASVMAEGVAG